jgi:hypothetical protein
VADGTEVVVVRKVLVAEGARAAKEGCRSAWVTPTDFSPPGAHPEPDTGWKIATGGDEDSSTDEEDF